MAENKAGNTNSIGKEVTDMTFTDENSKQFQNVLLL